MQIDAQALAGMDMTPDWQLEQTGENEQDTAFLQLLKNFDATQETQAERRRRQAAEEAARLEKLRQTQAANELYGRIAQLRSKVSAGGGAAVQAQLSAAQTELFWLLAGL